MKTVACVLKTGQWKNRNIRVEYSPAQVRWLRDQVSAHLRTKHRFVCLSDIDIRGVTTIPLKDDLPGWWSKIELFRELDDAFYIDLDTVIVGDITRMVKHKHNFTVLRNLSSKEPGRIGSGVMAWGKDYSYLYRKFMEYPDKHMAECVTSAMWGDQGWLQSHGGPFDLFQDLWPGRVKSFKFDLNRGRPAGDCRIVCFHGSPKPWEISADWIPEMMETV